MRKMIKQIRQLSFLIFALLIFSKSNAQIYQQQFSVDSASFNNRAMSNGYYVNSTSPTNAQLTYINSNNASVPITITGGKLTFTRPATGTFTAVRNAAFTATSFMMRFDYNITTASATTGTGLLLYAGNGFTNAAGAPTNVHSSIGLSISATGTPASYKVNNIGTAYNTTKTILWVVNNSGASMTYKAPDGTYETVADDTYDVWVGTVKEQNDIAATGGTQAISNFHIRHASGNATHEIDNVLVDPIPTTPTSSAGSSITNNSFTANWTAVSGVTGYRLDVATDAAFTSMVSGYNDLYISGQATNSYSVTGLSSGTYYYRVRAASQYAVGEYASGNSVSQTVVTTCSNPTINTQPSTSTQSVCLNGTATALSVSATGASSYQWYSNVSNSNTGGTLISGATNASYTPLTSSAGALYYYVNVNGGVGCNTLSNVSGLITVNSRPTPTFTTAPTGTVTINTNQTYTTQASQSSYIWTFSGTSGVDYNITSGGTSTDNSVNITWLTTGGKTITVNYNDANGCNGASSASSTITAASGVYYNVASTDVTVLTNWGTNTDGSGTNPANFTDAGLTFNIYNSGAFMGSGNSWTVNGTGSRIVVGNGSSSLSFSATEAITASSVDVNNNATLSLENATIPTLGTLASGSTVAYAAASATQAVTATTYSNLTLSGGGTRSFSGTVNIGGTFNPGTGFSATSGTIVLNGTSTSQAIPSFTYNGLTVSGVDGKTTSGNITVTGALNATNSFTICSCTILSFASTASMISTSGKVVTVLGTFDDQLASVSFSAGSGSMTIAAGGTFKFSGYPSGSNGTMSLTNINFTNGIGASGSTLLIASAGIPRLPLINAGTTINGNVTFNSPSLTLQATNFINSATTNYTITGNLNIISTGTGYITQASGGTVRTLNVQGNFNMTGGRYDVSGVGATGTNVLNVTGNINLNGSNDTLYTTSSITASGNGTINVQGNIDHTAGVFGKATTSMVGTIALTGTTMQDINTVGLTSNVNLTVNNANGVRLMSDLTLGSVLTFTSGVLRTNGYTLNMSGSTSSISGPTFGANATSFVAICDGSGTTVNTGGLKFSNIGTGGRTSAVTFPIGATPSTYNPCTVTNSSAAVDYTARVKNVVISGVTSTDAVQRTWNVQPASGTPNTDLGMQWAAADEGSTFTRTSASISHYNSGTTSIDVASGGGASSGSNPYTLSTSATNFNVYGDFGVTNGIIIMASEPTVQCSSASVTAGTTTMNVSWTAGNGTNSLVVVRQANAVNGSPVDGTTYADGSGVFASGTQIGTGNYVVYKGTGNNVTVTGLTSGVTYYVAVYSFNGNAASENYLTTSPATANGTTGIPTYYYVGGTGNTTNTFATANMWSTTLGGTPLAAFTPTNNDLFIFDGSNIGGGVSDSVTIAPVNSTTSFGKLILQNNARVLITASAGRTINIGNINNNANTVVLNINSGSKLYTSGSTITINLLNNSSASVSGNLTLGTGSNSHFLIPGSSGSSINVNSGGYVEANSSTSINPFGTSGNGVVVFNDGSFYRNTKGADVFGGTGNNVAVFQPNSTFIYNSNITTAQPISGRTFGNVIINTNWTPTAGSSGFTVNGNLSMPTTGVTFTMNETGSNIHFKGNITIASGATFKFNAASAATYNFSGTSLQTITNNGTWNLASTLNQSFILSNTAGLSVAGNVNISSLSGTSFTINAGCNLHLESGTFDCKTGRLNIGGTVSRNTGVAAANITPATVNITGSSTSIPIGFFSPANIKNLIINSTGTVTFAGNYFVSSSLTLTNGVLNFGTDTLRLLNATSSRTNGWVYGAYRKNFAVGSNVSQIYEVGDATSYLPVTITMANVTTAGDLTLKQVISTPSHYAYATAPIDENNYINRYWALKNGNTLVFDNYSINVNYKAIDIVGTATESSVVAAQWDSLSWTNYATTTAASYSNTSTGIVKLGDYILGNPCTSLVTPSVSISTASSTVCSGNSVSFSAVGTNAGSSPVYTWKKNGIIAGVGTSITFSPNTLLTGDIITCVLAANNHCQTTSVATSNSIILSVNQSPALPTILSQYNSTTTNITLCTIGQSIGLYPSISGGVWSSSNNLVATVANGGPTTSSAYLTANGNGVASILYTLTAASSGCSTATSIALTVNQQATPNAISGASAICAGSSATYTTSSTGGVWSTGGYSTITSGGVATASSAGSTSIRYTITNASGCSATSVLPITVNPLPAIPSISYASGTPGGVQVSGGGCKNKTFTIVGSPSNGVWTKTGVISISPSGTNSTTTVVNTGASTGAASVTYTYTNANGCVNSRTISSNVVSCGSKGIESNEISKNSFVIYPNPAHTKVNINVKTLVGNGNIVVTDLYGKSVKQQSLSIGNNTIDLSNCAKGIYLVSVITELGKETQKIVLE